MSSVWVCNASPLIVLSRIDRLDLLATLARPVLVPATVLAEIEAGRARDPAIEKLRASSPIEVVADLPVPERIARWRLDAGETQVITRAIAHADAGAVLDDRAGRRCARMFHIPLTGTVGLVALAKQHGRIVAAAPVFQDLIDAGLYVAPGLVRAVLSELGEATSA